jgi:Ni/Fe-hydrogenase subunit HybB-like protein
MSTLNPNLRLELLNYMSDLNLYNLPYAICTCTVGYMYLFLSALTPILILIACTQRNTTPYVVVSGVELISDTFTLSWEYHYSGIRSVGLPGAGTVIQCIKEGC